MVARIDKETVIERALPLLAVNPGASMQEVAAAAGIGRATLHRLFPGRTALLEELAQWALADTRAALDAAGIDAGPAAERVDALIATLLPVADRYAFLSNEAHLDDAPELRAPAADFEGRVDAFVRRGQRQGVFRPDLPAAWIGLTLMHLLLAAAEAVRIGVVGRREAPRLVREAFLAGVGTSKETPS